MKRNLRKYLAYLVFFAFLYQFAEKGIHVFEHVEETHCAEHWEKHFHDKEHDCFICDLDLVSQYAFVHFGENYKFNTVLANTISEQQIEFLSNSSVLFSPRGPPSFLKSSLI